MNTTKLTAALLFAGLTLTSGVRAADAAAATPEAPKPPARPTTLPPAATKQGVTFDKDIKPLFEASCVKCHGAQRPKAQLRLDTLEGVLKGSEDGKVLTVGDSAKSKLVSSIARINPKTAMPPEPRGPRRGGGGPGGPGTREGGEGHGEGGGAEKTGEAAKPAERPPGGPGGQGGRPQGPPAKPLTAEEVGLVRAWIDQGAK